MLPPYRTDSSVVERPTVNRDVLGSIPSQCAIVRLQLLYRAGPVYAGSAFFFPLGPKIGPLPLVLVKVEIPTSVDKSRLSPIVCQLAYTSAPMARGKPHVPKSFRLPPNQVQYIQKLKGLEIFGTKESDIVRSLIQFAINEMNRTHYIETHFKGLEMLDKGKAIDN